MEKVSGNVKEVIQFEQTQKRKREENKGRERNRSVIRNVRAVEVEMGKRTGSFGETRERKQGN